MSKSLGFLLLPNHKISSLKRAYSTNIAQNLRVSPMLKGMMSFEDDGEGEDESVRVLFCIALTQVVCHSMS